MKVLYDHQVFAWTKYAGIPRYFKELIQALMRDPNINISIPDFFTISSDYNDIMPNSQNNIRKLLMTCIDYSRVHWNKDFTRKICYPLGLKESINLLKSDSYDLFHPTSFDNYFLKYIKSKPFVFTVHDLIIEKYPEYYPISTININNVKQLSDNATQIISDSENTKKEFVDYYDIDSDKVTVVYLASSYHPKCIPYTQLQYNMLNQYLLYVNYRNGRKNFYTLIIAISKLLKNYNNDLICVGGGNFTDDEMLLFEKLGIKNHLKQCSVNNDVLRSLYISALAFIFPSLDEGFGLPILDAFACGCPVVLSNASCLPEVGGDAAVYFEPKNLKSIRDSVERVICDEKLREKNVIAGYKQLEKFSWEKCARETKLVYEKAIE